MSGVEIELAYHDDTAVVHIVGEIDWANHEEAGERLHQLVNEERFEVLDLTELRYLDSAGVKLLFDIGNALRQEDRELHIVVPVNAPLRRLLTITHVESIATIIATLAGALDLLHPRREAGHRLD